MVNKQMVSAVVEKVDASGSEGEEERCTFDMRVKQKSCSRRKYRELRRTDALRRRGTKRG